MCLCFSKNFIIIGGMLLKGLLDYISEDLVLLNIDAKDDSRCIERLGTVLLEKNCVKNTYIQAVKEREKMYPTGLSTDGVGVAIPHTMADHVNKPAVAIGTLEKPVLFGLMGDDEKKVEVQIIFQLAISDPSEQLEMLQSLVGLFADRELLQNIQKACSAAQVIALIRRAIPVEK